jgi:hypothetical protein
MSGMPVLRFAAVAALAVWVGGLLVLGGIAAPAIFEVVASRHVADGRMLSGAIFGEALRRFHLVSYACGAVIVVALLTRAVLGPRPRRFALRSAIAAIMLGASMYSGTVVSASIARVQQEIGPGTPASSLPAGDPRRAQFGWLHGQSTGLQFIQLAGGLLLLLFELGD